MVILESEYSYIYSHVSVLLLLEVNSNGPIIM